MRRLAFGTIALALLLSAISTSVRAEETQTCFQIRMKLWGSTGKGGLLGRYQQLGRQRRRLMADSVKAQHQRALQAKVNRLQRSIRSVDAQRHKIDIEYARLVHVLEEQDCNTRPGPAAAR